MKTPKFESIDLEEPLDPILEAFKQFGQAARAMGTSMDEAGKVLAGFFKDQPARGNFEKAIAQAAEAAMADAIVQRLATARSGGTKPDAETLLVMRVLMSSVTPEELLQQVTTREALTLPQLLRNHLHSKMGPLSRSVMREHADLVKDADAALSRMILGDTLTFGQTSVGETDAALRARVNRRINPSIGWVSEELSDEQRNALHTELEEVLQVDDKSSPFAVLPKVAQNEYAKRMGERMVAADTNTLFGASTTSPMNQPHASIKIVSGQGSVGPQGQRLDAGAAQPPTPDPKTRHRGF